MQTDNQNIRNNYNMNRLVTILSALLLVSCSGTLPELHENVTIDGSKGKLVGVVERPEVKGKDCPVVIYYHGLTGNKGENHIMAVRDSLLANGIAVVRFDFNGHGESEGPFSEMTLDNEAEDAELILEYVESLDWVDHSRVAVAGHSQGGLMASVIAGRVGTPRVRCAILMAPAACIHTMAVSGHIFGLDIAELPDSIDFWGGRQLGKNYMISALNMDPHAISASYTGPACIIQGTADNEELIVESKNYLNYIKDCEYYELEGLTHCYPEDYATPAHIAADFALRKLGLK